MAEVQWNSGLDVTRWRKELFTEAKNDTYFSRFFGGSGSAIQVLTDLNGAKGHKIKYGLKMKMAGAGVTGDSVLAGNEQSISTYTQEIELDQLRQGVLSEGKMANKRVLIDFRKEALDSLKIWFAERMEQDIIDTLSGASRTALDFDSDVTYSNDDMTYKIWSNDGTITTTVATGLNASEDIITTKLISHAKARAKLINPKFRPVRVDGKDYYLLIVHPETAHQLKQDSTWLNAQQYAMPRGTENPLFSGALGMWDGVVIHESDAIQKMTVSVNANRNLFLGAQAAVIAFGGDHNWHEETVDRGNKLSISASIIYETAKTQFNSADFGVMEMVCAAPDLT